MTTPVLETCNEYMSASIRMPGDVEQDQGRIRRISFCRGKQVRLRKIVSRSRAQPTFRYRSWKLGRDCEGEGYELHAFRLADCDPRVQWFAEQSCEIIYIDEAGEESSHYPDLLLLRDNEFVFWEEKPRRFAEVDCVRLRTELLQRELPHHNFRYEIKHAEDLTKKPRLEVATTLLQFGLRPMTLNDRWLLQQHIDRGASITWKQACTGVFGSYGRELLCRAVLEGILAVDMSLPMTRETHFVPGILEVWQ